MYECKCYLRSVSVIPKGGTPRSRGGEIPIPLHTPEKRLVAKTISDYTLEINSKSSLWGVAKGSSISWVAKFNGVKKKQNDSCTRR